MIIIPITHDEFDVYRLPYATFAIIGLCIVLFFATCGRIETETTEDHQRYLEIQSAYLKADYLVLPGSFLESEPAVFRKLYEKNQEWVAWFREKPDEVRSFLETHEKDQKPSTGGLADTLADTFSGSRGKALQKMSEAGEKLVESEDRKAEFLDRLSRIGSSEMDREQENLSRLVEDYDFFRSREILKRYGYTPSRPHLLALVSNLFLHGGLLHLLFNMLFLWLVAPKLEDIWGRPLFVSAFLVFGIVGNLAHQAVHPGSDIPLIGASGAIAGLMGAFLVRCSRARIRFFYAYWIMTIRVGTFDAPAFLMIPLWFLSELVYGIWFDVGEVAYWTHIGGFAAGVGLEALFRATRFEEKVLKYVPIEEYYNAPRLESLAAIPTPGKESGPMAAAAGNQALPKVEAVQARVADFRLTEVVITGFLPDGLETRMAGNALIRIRTDEIRYLAAGRVQTLNKLKDKPQFTISFPSAPAFLMALLRPIGSGEPKRVIEGFLIDGAKLSYKDLLAATHTSLHHNFWELLKIIVPFFPEARFLSRPDMFRENRLPSYDTVDEFLSEIRSKTLSI